MPEEPDTNATPNGTPVDVCDGGATVGGEDELPAVADCPAPAIASEFTPDTKFYGGTTQSDLGTMGDEPYCTNNPLDYKRCPERPTVGSSGRYPFVCSYTPRNTYRSPGAGYYGPYRIVSVVVNTCYGRGVASQSFSGCMERLTSFGWAQTYCDHQVAYGSGKKVFRLFDGCGHSGIYRVYGVGTVTPSRAGAAPLRNRGGGPRSSYIRC